MRSPGEAWHMTLVYFGVRPDPAGAPPRRLTSDVLPFLVVVGVAWFVAARLTSRFWLEFLIATALIFAGAGVLSLVYRATGWRRVQR
jgi:hypothetical protein